MTDTLNRRQRIAYTDMADIYKPLSTTDVNKIANDRQYPTSPTYKNLRCRYYQTDELAPPTPIGHMNRTNMLVIDKFHFTADVDLANGYVIKLTTECHLYKGLFWICQGNAKRRPSAGRRRANVCKVFAYRVPAPYGVV